MKTDLYYSQPTESSVRCSFGCEVESAVDLRECSRAGCTREELCDGCIFDCAGCGAGFCKDHVVDTTPAAVDAVYMCAGCRRAAAVAA